MKTGKLHLRSLLMLFLALAAGGSIWSQATGSIVGTVTDAGGAVVPGAKITLTNQATNEMKVVQSDQNGNYQFVQVSPGSYKVASRGLDFGSS